MKKKITAIMLTIAMALSIGSAFPVFGSLRTNATLDFTNPDVLPTPLPSGLTWDSIDGILTMENFNYTCDAATGIILPDDTIIEVNGTNTLTMSPPPDEEVIGIEFSEGLTIAGGGVLNININGITSSSTLYVSGICGNATASSTLKIDNTTLNINIGNCSSSADYNEIYGIRYDADTIKVDIINDATVSITMGDMSGSSKFEVTGIWLNVGDSELNIQDSALTITTGTLQKGGAATGIGASEVATSIDNSNVAVTIGEVTADNSGSGPSYPMAQAIGVEVNGLNVTNGSTVKIKTKDAESYSVIHSVAIASYGASNIADSELTAEAGSAQGLGSAQASSGSSATVFAIIVSSALNVTNSKVKFLTGNATHPDYATNVAVYAMSADPVTIANSTATIVAGDATENVSIGIFSATGIDISNPNNKLQITSGASNIASAALVSFDITCDLDKITTPANASVGKSEGFSSFFGNDVPGTDGTPQDILTIIDDDTGKDATHVATDMSAPPVALYNVSVAVKDSGDAPVTNATVKLMKGTTEVAQTTNTNGVYKFSNITPGVYSVVVTGADGVIITSSVIVANSDVTCNMKFLGGNKNTAVEIVGTTPPVATGGLNDLLEATTLEQTEQDAVDSGGSVKITLVADETIVPPIDKAAIQTAAAGKTVGMFIDLSVLKTVKDNVGTQVSETKIPTLATTIQIMLPIPVAAQVSADLTVYRVHGSNPAAALPKGSSHAVGGEYFEVMPNGTHIMLCVKNFSTYALGYTSGGNPNPPSGGYWYGGWAGSSDITVSFNSNGGSYVNPVKLSSGSTIDPYKYIPTKSGYAFGGWYTDSGLTKAVNANTRFDANTTLYVRWLEAAAPAPSAGSAPAVTSNPQTGDSWFATLFA